MDITRVVHFTVAERAVLSRALHALTNPDANHALGHLARGGGPVNAAWIRRAADEVTRGLEDARRQATAAGAPPTPPTPAGTAGAATLFAEAFRYPAFMADTLAAAAATRVADLQPAADLLARALDALSRP